MFAFVEVTISMETLKVLGFGALLVGLVALARWSSRVSESSAYRPEDIPPQPMTRVASEHPYGRSDVTLAESVAAQPDVEVHPPFAAGGVIIESLWFETFDALTGPPEPGAFCDEMTVGVYLPESGRKFEQTFVVATPEGMRKRLTQAKWTSMFLPELLVVDRYNLDEIRQFVIERLSGEDPDAASIEDQPTIVEQVNKHRY